jgi:hypothetical protein
LSRTILIFGAAGGIGRDMINFLSVTPRVGSVTAADIDEEKGLKIANDATRNASYLGYGTRVEFRRHDLSDVNETAELLKEVSPVVTVNATTLGSWWTSHLFPQRLVKKVAPLGPWIPNHLLLTLKLMQAVKKSGVDTKVINCSLPDAVNCILSKMGLSPVCGGGNFDLVCEIIRHRVSQKLSVPMNNVIVYGVGDHSHYTSAMEKPWWLKIIVGGKDVTENFDVKEDLVKGSDFYTGPVHRSEPPREQTFVSAAYTKNILSIYFDEGRIHSSIPGPNGLPGSYPTRLSGKGAEVVMPEGITLEEATKIVEQARRNDAIEAIKDDGTVVYVRKMVKDFREVTGYECYELKINEVEERATELNALVKSALKKYSS